MHTFRIFVWQSIDYQHKAAAPAAEEPVKEEPAPAAEPAKTEEAPEPVKETSVFCLYLFF